MRLRHTEANEIQLDIIRNNTKAGLASARARGRVGGRPVKADEEKIKRIKQMYKKKEMTVKEICQRADISNICRFQLKTTIATFYKYFKL